ncbi:hypothetical protein PMZ80_011135 [Knufia obscura]|uniref:Uncharacterized protein n=1 Tax=Knufia obscura TaxID=1635080 RepID=A0ABR0R8M6_9EURO|nr:hypothetical protein PMZ80_011135 [Knufia obscura]
MSISSSGGPFPEAGYFGRFGGFEHDESASLVEEFDRLALHQSWSSKSKRYRQEKQKCFAEEFHRHYGKDTNKLSNWQHLCREVGIEPQKSITQCKRMLSKVAVNIVDLVDHRRTGSAVQQFASKARLRRYSITTGKIFSKKNAKEDGYLSALLIQMF